MYKFVCNLGWISSAIEVEKRQFKVSIKDLEFNITS